MTGRTFMTKSLLAVALAASTIGPCEKKSGLNFVKIDGSFSQPNLPGLNFSNVDNPVYRADVHLEKYFSSSTNTSVFEEASSKSSAWQYVNCDLHSKMTSGNASKGSVPDPELVPKPVAAGTWSASGSNNSFQWEVRGLRLGYEAMLVGADKERTDHTRIMAAGAVSAVLAPGTMLVPIQVLRVLPKNQSSSFFEFMQVSATEPRFRNFFDFLPNIKRQGVSHPGGLLALSQYSEFSGFLTWTQPDAIWRQAPCHIQWRMISFVDLLVDDDKKLSPNSCSSLELKAIWSNNYSQAVAAELIDKNIPTLMVVASTSKVGCVVEGLGRGPSQPLAVIGITATGKLSVAHELGHVLGLNDAASGLMNSQLPMTTISGPECTAARKNAATFVKYHWKVDVTP